MPSSSISFRAAERRDTPLILDFVRELAEYERLLHMVRATEADLEAALFAPTPRVFCQIVEAHGEAVGFALWFYNFSTFAGRGGIWVEDLYVRPAARGLGAGRGLLAALAARCLDEGLTRLEWAVLDWNAPAIGFYDSLGAGALDDWTTRRLEGEALARLAGASSATGAIS